MILLGTMWMMSFPDSEPFDRCSEEYQKYVNMDGIEASYVKDFKINDTIVLDVTVLKALDSSSFEMLVSDFKIPENPPGIKEEIENGEDLVSIMYIFKNDIPHNSAENNYNEVALVTSRLHRTLTFYHLHNESEKKPLLFYVFKLPLTRYVIKSFKQRTYRHLLSVD